MHHLSLRQQLYLLRIHIDMIIIHFSLRAWDLGTDRLQYEQKGIIKTVTRRATPVVKRSASIPNILLPSTNRPSISSCRLPSIVEPGSEDFSTKRRRSYHAEFDR